MENKDDIDVDYISELTVTFDHDDGAHSVTWNNSQKNGNESNNIRVQRKVRDNDAKNQFYVFVSPEVIREIGKSQTNLTVKLNVSTRQVPLQTAHGSIDYFMSEAFPAVDIGRERDGGGPVPHSKGWFVIDGCGRWKALSGQIVSDFAPYCDPPYAGRITAQVDEYYEQLLWDYPNIPKYKRVVDWPEDEDHANAGCPCQDNRHIEEYRDVFHNAVMSKDHDKESNSFESKIEIEKAYQYDNDTGSFLADHGVIKIGAAVYISYGSLNGVNLPNDSKAMDYNHNETPNASIYLFKNAEFTAEAKSPPKPINRDKLIARGCLYGAAAIATTIDLYYTRGMVTTVVMPIVLEGCDRYIDYNMDDYEEGFGYAEARIGRYRIHVGEQEQDDATLIEDSLLHSADPYKCDQKQLHRFAEESLVYVDAQKPQLHVGTLFGMMIELESAIVLDSAGDGMVKARASLGSFEFYAQEFDHKYLIFFPQSIRE